ncbi:hypothetical protein LUX12_02175 [Streptomyces somaliensis]|uniref:hypothetical protein n=1 Tax=Streptomyces somaliensis TaxID=78355 RepID=UPI0020CCA00A|nr:hypothetical protein [Streptomyces somaliensis]MCP9943874.1 hypothetical protein [Streptomyces somaliensis]MCP9975723.1 hypothetical protein [Streptomyces somaliensis]
MGGDPLLLPDAEGAAEGGERLAVRDPVQDERLGRVEAVADDAGEDLPEPLVPVPPFQRDGGGGLPFEGGVRVGVAGGDAVLQDRPVGAEGDRAGQPGRGGRAARGRRRTGR